MRKFLILIGILFFLAIQGQAAETTWRHSGFELWSFDLNFTNHNASNVELVNGVNFTESLKEDYNYLVYNTSGTNYNCGSVVSWCYVVLNGTTKKVETTTTNPSTALTYTVNTGSDPTKIKTFGDFVFTSCPINRCLNLSGKSNITIDGQGKTNFYTTNSNMWYIFEAVQLDPGVTTLNDINVSNTTIPITTTSFNVGDWVNINSSVTISPDIKNIFEGEIQKVDGIDSSKNELYVSGGMYEQYNTSDNAVVRRFVNFSENIEISGISMYGTSTIDGVVGILMYGGFNVKIHDVSCSNYGTYCIWGSSLIDSYIYNNIIDGGNKVGWGEGIVVGDASNNVQVFNNYIRNSRHGTGLNSATAAVSGLTRGVNFHHNSITNSSSYAMDAHAVCEDATFEYNNINGYFYRAENSVGGAGIAYGCRKVYIRNNDIRGATMDISPAIINRGVTTSEVYITDNTIENLQGTFSHGIVVLYMVKQGEVSGNIINNTAWGIRIDRVNTSGLFVIKNNIINSRREQIRIETSQNISVEDNILLGALKVSVTQPSNVFFSNNFGYYDYNDIRGNTVRFLNSTNKSVLTITDAGDTISENAFKGFFDLKNSSVNDTQLLLNLKFDENKTGVVLDPTVYDSSVYGLKGTFIGNATANYTDGVFGSAMLFDGANDYVTLNVVPQISLNEKYTIAGWIYPTDVSQTQDIYENSKAANNFLVGSITNGVLAFGMYNGTSYVSKASGTVANNNWYNFIYIYDNTVGTLYLNGVKQTGTATPAASVLTGARLGSSTNNDKLYFGKIDEFRIYNRTLSDQEAKTLYYSNPQNERVGVIQANNFTVVNSTGQPTLQVNQTGVISNLTMPVCSKDVVNQTGSTCFNSTSQVLNTHNGTRWLWSGNGTEII